MERVLAANPKQLEDYRGGKTKLAGFFTGQVRVRVCVGVGRGALLLEGPGSTHQGSCWGSVGRRARERGGGCRRCMQDHCLIPSHAWDFNLLPLLLISPTHASHR